MAEFLETMKDSSLKLIPGSCVRRRIFPEDENRNAIWDMIVTRAGRCFLSLCAEQAVSRSAGVYEYDYEKNSLTLCFECDELVFPYKDAIAQSKIHTSMSEMNDGRIIMTTHTTAKSPRHPFWNPEPFYNHTFEGFQGSSILIYDPATGRLENRGTPIPHESIYGGCYDPKNNDFYFTGYFRGHLYRFDIDTGSVTDYGKVTEFGTFRLYLAKDGNIYSASRSGNFYRINTDTKKIEELGILFERDYMPYSVSKHVQLDYLADAPDGNLYLKYIFGKNMYKYSYEKNTLECVGDYTPASIDRTDPYSLYGMAFDKNGVLWYTIAFMKGFEPVRCYLCKWDILGGGEPQNMGILGTLERTVSCPSEMHYRDGKLYIADSNYYFAPPGMIVVDIDKLEALDYSLEDESTVFTRDFMNYENLRDPRSHYKYSADEYDRQYKANEPFRSFNESYAAHLSENSMSISAKRVYAYALWKKYGSGNCRIDNVFYEGEKLFAELDVKAEKRLLDPEGDREVPLNDPRERENIISPLPPLPAVPGRAFRAVASATVRMSGTQVLIGTEDGMLAVWDGKSDQVFSLGACPGTSGRIAALTYCAATDTAYGISGGEDDICILFSYDAKRGVRYLGRAHFETENGLFVSSVLNKISVSESGKRVAFGSNERMSALYELLLF